MGVHERPPFGLKLDRGSPQGEDVIVSKLLLDGFAQNSKPKSKAQGSENFACAFEQTKGIWDAFDDILALDGGECDVFRQAFPLSAGRPLPNDVAEAAKFVCASKCATPFLRSQLCQLERIAEYSKSTPEYAAWHESLPEDFSSLLRDFGPVLWVILGRICGIDMTELCDLFHSGFPILGAFSAPGVYDEKVTLGPESVEDVMSHARAKWGELDRLFRNEACQDVLWAKTMEEVECGWLSGPYPLSELSTSQALPARRFGVEQKDKVRAVGNL